MHTELIALRSQAVQMIFSDKNARYDAPTTMESAVEILATTQSRLIAGSTDLGVQINKGRHGEQRFLDLRLLDGLYTCEAREQALVVGARVTLTELRSQLLEHFPAYADYMNLFVFL
jgi:xanthine dehydrogenase small subunit